MFGYKIFCAKILALGVKLCLISKHIQTFDLKNNTMNIQ